MEHEFHEVAEQAPKMTPEEFASLVASIKRGGLREPILLFDGKIVDGRHRYLACKEAGKKPKFEKWEGAFDDMVDHVRDINLERRSLNVSQRSMYAAKMARLKLGDNQYTGEGASKEAPLPQTQAQAAEKTGVSRASVQRARKVQENGVPELVDMVEGGQLAVTTAQMLARQPKDKQSEVCVGGPGAVKAWVSDNRKKARKRAERGDKLSTQASAGPAKSNGSPSTAIHCANRAIDELRRIKSDDKQRRAALRKVADWIDAHREEGQQ